MNGAAFTISGFWCMILGFMCFVLFDLNLISHNNNRMETLYSVGAGLMGLGVFQDIMENKAEVSGVFRVIFGILAVAAFAALIYCTFVVGKRSKWGKEQAENRNWWQRKLVDTGVYALCRHPAVWCWWVFLLSLVVCYGYKIVSAILFCVMGFLLALYEDRSVYPKVTPGYDNYKEKTPFLFPNSGSAQRCRETAGKNRKRK